MACRLIPAAAAAIAAMTISATPAPAPVWLIKSSDLARVDAAGLDPGIRTDAFAAPAMIGYGATSSPYPGHGPGTAARLFTSYAALDGAFTAGWLPGPFSTIIFDLEAWDATPLNEQQHPGYWEHKAAALVHKHGMRIVNTPARDLAKAAGRGDLGGWYLETSQAGMAAAGADAVVIQSQPVERNPGQYQSFVTKAAAQARAANPDVLVLAGLSTTTRCQVYPPPTTAQLVAAYESVFPSVVAGFWLNVPINKFGTGCCLKGCPRTAVAFLDGLYG